MLSSRPLPTVAAELALTQRWAATLARPEVQRYGEATTYFEAAAAAPGSSAAAAAALIDRQGRPAERQTAKGWGWGEVDWVGFILYTPYV